MVGASHVGHPARTGASERCMSNLHDLHGYTNKLGMKLQSCQTLNRVCNHVDVKYHHSTQIYHVDSNMFGPDQ